MKFFLPRTVDFSSLVSCSFDWLVCVVLDSCVVAPCCPARLYRLLCVFYCVLSKINERMKVIENGTIQ